MGKAEIEAADEIYKTAREDADMEMTKLREEIEAIRVESQAMGVLKKIEYDQAHNEVLKSVVLLRLRDSKEYKKGGMTWARFCEEVIGEPKRTIDERIADIRPLVDKFWADFAQIAGMPFNKIRLLGRSIGRESAQIEDGVLVIDNQRIPLTPENKDEIEAAIDALKAAKEKEAEEARTEAKVKARQLKSKDGQVKKLEKTLAKLEAKAEERGYTPGEEAFIQKMENARVTIDGFLMDFDTDYPNTVPDDATARMKAAFMTTLSYFKRVITAAFDTASELYGDMEFDDAWIPPHLHPEEDCQKPENGGKREETGVTCQDCQWHKARNNPAKGVKIPGEFGKCTRPDGLCDHINQNSGL